MAVTMAKNYYELLGLHYEAEDIVVRAAYKALAQKYHPDKSPSNAEHATVIMTQFSEAYQVLNDRNLRKRYDEVLNRRPFNEAPTKPASAASRPAASTSANKQSHPSNSNSERKANSNPSGSSSSQAKSHHQRESAFDFESDGPNEHEAQFAVNLTRKLIEKIEANQIDEGHLVSLFEKLFQQTIIVHHGMLNSYSFEHAGKKYTHNFSTLKMTILRRLQEAVV
jgi:curved DNA-binding protein CbpA